MEYFTSYFNNKNITNNYLFTLANVLTTSYHFINNMLLNEENIYLCFFYDIS